MNELDQLIEAFLTEAVALTKGSQRVMNDKNLVSNLADAIRDDASSNPRAFAAGFSKQAKKLPDEELAQWFLENLDRIEAAGYEGTIYSRDGAYSEWIVRRYIAGSHNWEDITGVMNMNMRDWTILKNRNMLDANHRDIPKFNSVRDLGRYMTVHYNDKLEQVRDAAKNAERNKKAKTIKVVDNDDYKIFVTLNRAAACAVGLGTQWCTANSNHDSHFHRYAGEAFLFQMFPKNPEKVDKISGFNQKHITGDEKYQFGADSGLSFKDIADDQVNKNIIKERFPYIYTDIVHGIKSNKEKIEQAFKELSDDPTLQDNDFKIKTYELDKELEKLHKFVNAGYFTDKVRPKKVEQPATDTPPEQPQLSEEDDEAGDMQTGGSLGSMGAGVGPSGGGKYPPGTAPTMPESVNKGRIMENVDKDIAAILQSLKKYDKLVESVAPVLGMRTLGEKKGGKPEWLIDAEKKAEEKENKDGESDSEGGEIDEAIVSEKDEGKHNNGKTTGFKAVEKKAAKEYGSKEAGEKVAGAVHAKMAKAGKLEESNEADPDVLTWMKRFASLGNMKGYGR
jgi:hypothetical protein